MLAVALGISIAPGKAEAIRFTVTELECQGCVPEFSGGLGVCGSVTIGTGYPNDVVVLEGGVTSQARNVRILVGSDTPPAIVPEPGAAGRIGLGLAGLALRRRTSAVAHCA